MNERDSKDLRTPRNNFDGLELVRFAIRKIYEPFIFGFNFTIWFWWKYFGLYDPAVKGRKNSAPVRFDFTIGEKGRKISICFGEKRRKKSVISMKLWICAIGKRHKLDPAVKGRKNSAPVRSALERKRERKLEFFFFLSQIEIWNFDKK